jgi:glucosylceramidase
VADNVEYYAIGQSSEFVQPGAVRIGSISFTNLLETTAYKNPDGTEVLLALNPATVPASFKVTEGGQYFTYTLPAQSVVTFEWQAVPEPRSGGLLLAGLAFFLGYFTLRRVKCAVSSEFDHQV